MAVDTASPKTGRARRHATRKKPRKKGFKAWLRRWWWLFVAVPAALVLGAIGVLFYAYTRLELPDTPPPLQTTYIFDSNDHQIATLHAGVDRTIIPLAQMPVQLRQAVIAAEDADFYEHGGVDPLAIVRAAWTDVIAGDTVQGGSTITQQVVKNVYAGEYTTDPETEIETYAVPPRTIGQKVREALLAIKVEREFTKDEILATYLNTVYFGRGAYGVQAAAQTYWQKDASELTISESAVLAGLIQSPSTYDPVVDPEGAEVRRDYVFDRMVATGSLTAGRAAALKAEDVVTNELPVGPRFPAKLGYFLDHTRRELSERYGEGAVFSGGLQVTTTLDMDMQRAAQEAVATQLDTPGGPDAALVAIVPQTGEIRAMYGGRNFNAEHVNLATGQGGTGRQAGSAFKVFTLLAALEQRYSLNETWYGPSPITIEDPACYTNGEPWQLSNASDSESGYFSLLSATTHSVNTVYAQVASAVTPQAIVDVAYRMGIRSELEPVCSITLGTQSVTPLEMASAYGTLAARGEHHRPTTLIEVDDPNGETREFGGPGQQVLLRNDADLATYALETVITGGTGYRAAIGRPAAGKTGTAQEYWDAWFCGYVPQLATCVWVGYEEGEIPLENVEGFSAVFGGTIPAMIWHEFMAEATANMDIRDFADPSFEGYTEGPPEPVFSPTPSPPPSPSPSPEPEPSESPSPEPEPSESPSPDPSPSPSTPPSPSASPTQAPSLARARDP